MSSLAVVHRTLLGGGGGEVVVARWREQPRVDRENRELEEAALDVFEAEAMVARNMARYQADQEAVKAAEAA
jgi:hypothetical protein